MTDLFPSLPFYSVKRMTEAIILDETNAGYEPSAAMEMGELVIPRIEGLLFLTGSLLTLGMAWKRREFVFHRLVLGMALHMFVTGASLCVGTVAIPRNVSGYIGNIGTAGTCTAQGFFIWFNGASMLCYYAGISFYSHVAILSGFEKPKYQWCEKWIHLVVHIYPIGTSLYLLIINGFNAASGVCYIGSYPRGCEFNNDVSCERGLPVFGAKEFFIFYWFPMTLIVLLPSVIMADLYFKVKKQEHHGDGEGSVVVVESQCILKQSWLYLIAIYCSVVPSVIVSVVGYVITSQGIGVKNGGWYKLALYLNFSLFGMLTMAAYRYFTVDPTKVKKGAFNIFSLGSAKESDTPVARRTEIEDESQQRTEFNIFDGTNAGGDFADFIHDGDSDDEREDQLQSKHWASVQDHI